MNLGRWTRRALLLAAIVYAAAALRYRVIGTDGQAWQNTINGDGDGYHGMLVGLFMHGNPAKAPIRPAFFTPAGGGHVIKYTCGAPLMQAPFFLIAHAIANMRGADGLSGLGIEYQTGVLVAGFTWAMLGLLLIARIGARAGIADNVTAFVLLLLALGTGLMYYAIITPAMSHAYGFAAVSWSLYEAQGVWLGRRRALQRMAIALGVMALVRPTLGLVLFMLPAVALLSPGSWRHALAPRAIVSAAAIGTVVLLIQPLLWKLQCGAWLADGYAAEGFNWSRPRIWSVLFGARKGFFFYWPALLLLLPALVWALRRNPRPMALVLLGLVATAYATSAWWNWYYGHGYGMRALIDVLPACALVLLAWLGAMRMQARSSIMICTVPLILLQLFQSWQYEMGIIHPFNMDREKYALSFLRTDAGAAQRFGNGYIAELHAPHGWDTLAVTSLTRNGILELSATNMFSPALRLSHDDLPIGRQLYAEIALQRRAIDPLASDSVMIVYTYATSEQQRMHVTFAMNDIRGLNDAFWRHWRHAFNVPIALPGEELSIYLWHTGKGRVLVRDLSVAVRAVRD